VSAEDLINIGLSKELVVFIISMLPIAELRGALPIAINVYDIPWYYAFTISYIGNLLPVPFILLFLEKAAKWLRRWPAFERFFDWLFERARRRSKLATRYQRIGLALFVAIPLPVTGAWTGSIIAVLLGLNTRAAFVSIAVGIFIAGVIITILSLLGWAGAIIAGVLLALATITGLWRLSSKPEQTT